MLYNEHCENPRVWLSALLLRRRGWGEERRTYCLEDHPADLTPPVQDGGNDGILVEFVFSMPLFCWSTWRTRVKSSWRCFWLPSSAVAVPKPLLLPLELGWCLAALGYSRKTWGYSGKGTKNTFQSEWQETIFNVSSTVLIRLTKWKILAILRVPQ